MAREAICGLLAAGLLAGNGNAAAGQVSDARPAPVSGASGSGAAPAPQTGGAEPQGSRDPFVSPIRGAPETAAPERPRGMAGIAVGELTLRGLVLSDGAYIAVVESDGGRHLLLRGGEKLFDGVVRGVSADGVLLVRGGAGSAPPAAGDTVRLTLGAAPGADR